VTSITCSQEVEDITAIPSSSTGVRKRLRIENSSILYGEIILPSPQSPIQFEIITKEFVQRLYYPAGSRKPTYYTSDYFLRGGT
jgi:hypothetical protein